MPATPTPARRQAYREAWAGEATFATTLLVLVTDVYGSEAFTWSAETLKLEIEDDFDVKLPSANLDRLMTAIAIVTTDAFNTSLPDFIQFCNILSGDSYDPRAWDPADAMEVAWGVTEAMLIERPEGDDPFSDEIRAYIGAILEIEGIITPPDILRLAMRDSDPGGMVDGEFSDDPEMFSAIYGFEKMKTDEIERNLRDGLTRLSHQLEQVPVQSGSTKDVVKRMLRNVAA